MQVEDREDVGLKERDQQFERGQRDGQAQWQYRTGPAGDAHRT